MCARLLCAKGRHWNWNIESRAGDSHAAFAGGGRKSATGTLALASGSPEHEAEHAVRGSRAVRRNCLDKIGSGFLIRSAESCAVRFSGDQPKASGQLGRCKSGNATDSVNVLRPASLESRDRRFFRSDHGVGVVQHRSAGAEPMRGGIRGKRLEIKIVVTEIDGQAGGK